MTQDAPQDTPQPPRDASPSATEGRPAQTPPMSPEAPDTSGADAASLTDQGTPEAPFLLQGAAEEAPEDDDPEDDYPEDDTGGPAPVLCYARPLDAGKLAAMMTDDNAAKEWMPSLHTGAEDIAFVARMIDNGWVTTAWLGDEIAGFIAREKDYIHSLYIADFAQGKGVGTALLDYAKQDQDSLTLWTFQANRGAQRFYRREGFQPVEETAGQGNDEGLPDIRFLWERPKPPSAKPESKPETKSEATPDASRTSAATGPGTSPKDQPR